MSNPYDYITIIDDQDWKLIAIIPHINSPEPNQISNNETSKNIPVNSNKEIINISSKDNIPRNKLTSNNLLPNVPRNSFLLGIDR